MAEVITRWLDASLERAARRLSVPLEPAARAMVRTEQLRILWGHSSVGIVAAAVFAVMLAVFVGGAADVAWLRGWLTLKLGVALARLVQAQAHARAAAPGSERWRLATLLSLAVDALTWGVAGAWLAGEPVAIAAVAVASLAGIASVATFGLQTSFAATLVYTAPILLPTSAGMLLRGDDVGAIGSAGLALLLGLQLATAWRSERGLVDSLLLSLKAHELAAAKNAALELALRQSAVKAQFLASISHELRTPLHGILGIARLLHMERGDDPRVTSRVELIEASGTHLLSIINDLLDISRLEAGRFAMRDEAFELTAQLDNVVATHAVRAEDHGLRLVADVRIERPSWVSGDPARFRQVLHNLVGNAVKFTQHGSVTVTLDRLGRDVVRVQVGDTGPGIAPGDLARVFEAFTQSDEALTRPAEGVGLGLAIAREIARAMGGDVVAQSTLGIGSLLTFTARLPPAEMPAARPEPRRAASEMAPLAPARVLLAEDDETNALIAIAFLERLGMSVERVEDGRAAVRRALREVERPALVLMDCRMPTMDGYAATREIRTQEIALELPRVPVIALTATMTDADRQSCLDAGMDDFLAKPYTIEQLAQRLGRWIGAGAPTSGGQGQGVAPEVEVGVLGLDHEGVQRVS